MLLRFLTILCPLSLYSYATPQHRLRKIKQVNGRVVFALTVSRLAHPTPVQGQMESKWGFHRSEITKYTGACIAWLMDE